MTPDHVNPEAPWPTRAAARGDGAGGQHLTERLAIYPDYAQAIRALARPGAADARCCAQRRRRLCARNELDAGAAGNELRAATAMSAPAMVDRIYRPVLSEAIADGGSIDGRDRFAVHGARRGVRRGLRRRRRAAAKRQRRHRELCRQPQHQLHQHLQSRLPLLRVLEGQARRHPARPGLRSRPRRNRAPRARGVGSRRDRSLHAGRHSSALHRQDLSRILDAAKRAERRIHVHAFSPLEVQHGARASGFTSATFSTG